jgi:hypothetical protein
MKEKFLLKDNIHMIERFNTLSLEEKNYAIEGNDTGLMGAGEAWTQVPKTSE